MKRRERDSAWTADENAGWSLPRRNRDIFLNPGALCLYLMALATNGAHAIGARLFACRPTTGRCRTTPCAPSISKSEVRLLGCGIRRSFFLSSPRHVSLCPGVGGGDMCSTTPG